MKRIFYLFVSLAVTAGVSAQNQLPAQLIDPTVIAENRTDMSSYSFPFDNIQKALLNNENSDYYLSLNGIYDFYFAENPSGVDPDKIFQPDFQPQNPQKIKIPADWQLNGFGYPIYTNVVYDFSYNPQPPSVPFENNWTGCYRVPFTVPDSWKGKDVILSLDGVRSAFFIWINGKRVGFGTDSKLASQYNITPYLNADSKNVLGIEVFRWSAASYLEDQDFFRLNGIERGISIFCQEKINIKDVKIDQKFNDDMSTAEALCKVVIDNSKNLSDKINLKAEIYSGDKLIDSKSINNYSAKSGIDTVNFNLKVNNPLLWNAESPSLYRTVISFTYKGKTYYSTHNTGFRKIEIKNGVFYLNNKKIFFKGVNRHEHDEKTGHVISRQSMLEDIKLMKINNFNAVRTCHYPDDNYWYHLCDSLGIYLIDEANVESHGMGYGEKSLAKFPEWKNAHVQRALRMVNRDYNHPSVLIWSLGNEAGNGENFYDSYKAVKALDKSRPVHYEQAINDFNTDIVCPMYPWYFLLDYNKQKHDRPFIMCEYEHSMGNSTGGFDDYWQVIKSSYQLQGGFIWDWVDQGIAEIDSVSGVKYWNWGGDYGPAGTVSTDNFCMNGLVSPDRTPHPALHEVKHVFSNAEFKIDTVNYGVWVKNTYSFISLNKFKLEFDLLENGKIINNLTVDCGDILPDNQKLFPVPFLKTFRKHLPNEYFLNCRLVLKENLSCIPAGNCCADAQLIVYKPENFIDINVNNYKGGKISAKKTADLLNVKAGNNLFVFNLKTGYLESFVKNNKQNILKSAVKPNFTRPLTDNDFGNKAAKRCIIWTDDINSIKLSEISYIESPEGYKIQSIYKLSNSQSELKMTYTIFRSGKIRIGESLSLDKDKNLPELQRFGVNFHIVKDFSDALWYGRGPWENYRDRMTGAFCGIYSMPVKDLYFPYPSAQESGNRCETRYLIVSGKNVDDLKFSSVNDGYFDFSVLPYSQSDLTAPSAGTIHLNQLPCNDFFSVCIDYRQSGVGGDDSWGSTPHNQYRLFADHNYDFSFYLE